MSDADIKEEIVRRSPKKTPYIESNQSGLTPEQHAKVQKRYGSREEALKKRGLSREGTSLAHTDFVTATGNFDTLRSEIGLIVLHTVVGTVQSAIDTFGRVGRIASAHYIVGLDGKYFHGLEEYFTAYHAGNLVANRRSIGIEHADNGDYNGPRTPELYEASSVLVADICKYYNIPCRLLTREQATAGEKGIIDHRNITLSSTACPDFLDINRIIKRANEILNGGILNDPSTVLNALEPILCYNNAWWSSLYRVKLMKSKFNKSNPQQSVNDIKPILYFDNAWWSSLYRVKEMRKVLK